MENTELFTLKTDVLNKLRTDKYLLNDKILKTAYNNSLYQEERIEKVIEFIKEITALDQAIVTTQQIFVDNAKTSETTPQSNQNESQSNVIEGLNSKGQTHSE